ncbi:DUF4334 domain-containing protein [Spirillospora sp. NPDC049652]
MGSARLREVVLDGVASAAMIYDGRPIIHGFPRARPADRAVLPSVARKFGARPGGWPVGAAGWDRRSAG